MYTQFQAEAHMHAKPCLSCCRDLLCCSSPECLERHKPEHMGHCDTCQELQTVINVDMERFIQPVPFTTCHTQVFG